MTTYAITGVTGHFGQTAIKVLAQLAPTDQLVALARNTQKAAALVPSGVEVRPGDYDDQAELTHSLQGVDRLLFVSSQPGGPVSRIDQHRNVVAVAKAAGVKYIAYTSFPHADTATTPLAGDHRATEEAIGSAGIAHSFLRNNWYLENEAGTLRAAAAGQPFVYSAAEGKAGWALESEYAEAAARVLVTADPAEIYEFAGPARTYADLAAAIPGDFSVQGLSDADYTKGLVASGLDEGTAALITSFQTLIRDGQLAEETTALADVLERPLVPLADAIQQVITA